MRKYGINHFHIDLIEETDSPEEREIYWIEQKQSFKNGYNATMGGDGRKFLDYDLIISTYRQLENIAMTAKALGIDKDSVHNVLTANNIPIKSSQDVIKDKSNYSKKEQLLNNWFDIKCREVFKSLYKEMYSMVSKYGQPSGIGYPTSKFAVNGFTLSLARELASYNIRVNAVAPGITNTDMVKKLPQEMIEPLIKSIPLGRIGEPKDIANAYLFLASDMASYITGVILSVDGLARS